MKNYIHRIAIQVTFPFLVGGVSLSFPSVFDHDLRRKAPEGKSYRLPDWKETFCSPSRMPQMDKSTHFICLFSCINKIENEASIWNIFFTLLSGIETGFNFYELIEINNQIQDEWQQYNVHSKTNDQLLSIITCTFKNNNDKT